MVYSGALGKLIHENNPKSKISSQTPFKVGSENLKSFRSNNKSLVRAKDPYLNTDKKLWPVVGILNHFIFQALIFWEKVKAC